MRNIASCLVKYKLIFILRVKCIVLFEKILLNFWSVKFLVPFNFSGWYFVYVVSLIKPLKKIKVVSATFALVCFSSVKESTYKIWKIISFQKLFSLPRKLNFCILYFQISWRHRMPKHKTSNTFYWITWEVNTFC